MSREVKFLNYVGSTACSSRNMHALRRPDLECSLNIYAKIYVKTVVCDEFRVLHFTKFNLDCCSLCISDCVG